MELVLRCQINLGKVINLSRPCNLTCRMGMGQPTLEGCWEDSVILTWKVRRTVSGCSVIESCQFRGLLPTLKSHLGTPVTTAMVSILYGIIILTLFFWSSYCVLDTSLGPQKGEKYSCNCNAHGQKSRCSRKVGCRWIPMGIPRKERFTSYWGVENQEKLPKGGITWAGIWTGGHQGVWRNHLSWKYMSKSRAREVQEALRCYQ